MTDPTISPRLPTTRTDNKIILNCQSCHFRCLVDVVKDGQTDWICPSCRTVNRVTSRREERHEWIKELARKAGMRSR